MNIPKIEKDLRIVIDPTQKHESNDDSYYLNHANFLDQIRGVPKNPKRSLNFDEAPKKPDQFFKLPVFGQFSHKIVSSLSDEEYDDYSYDYTYDFEDSEDGWDDCGGCGDYVRVRVRKERDPITIRRQEPIVSDYLKLIRLQSFDGFWEDVAGVLEIYNISKQITLEGIQDRKIICTIIALALLQLNHEEHKQASYFIENKARKWIKSQDQSLDIDNLIRIVKSQL